jgi:Putative DNA-binding domain
MPVEGESWDVAFVGGLLAPQVATPYGLGAKRFAVYRNNVTVGLVRALEANFPVVRRLLGGEYFHGFARQFAQAHPPRSPLMFFYGAQFPVALANERELAAYPYLADVARLEILWRESFHAADANALEAGALAGLDGDVLMKVVFSRHPAVRLVQSEYAIADIFHANTTEAPTAVIRPAVPQRVVVHRMGVTVHVTLVSAAEFAFLAKLFAGVELGAAAEHGFDVEPAFDLAAALANALQGGYFQSMIQG